MALAVNDQSLRRIYSALVTAHFYETTIWGSLGSRNYEADLQSAYSTLIQTETYNTTVANRTRAELHSGFVNATTPTSVAETMVMDQAVESAQNVPMLDRLEGIQGARLFDRAAREAAVEMANHVDDCFGSLITGISFGTGRNTRTNQRLGSNTDFIDRSTGLPSTDEAADLIFRACVGLVLWARRNHLSDGIQIGGPSLSDLYLLVAPELAAVASERLLKLGLASDRPGIAGAARVGILRYDTVMVGRVQGVDIYSATQLEAPASGAGAQWDCYGGVRQGVEFASRPLNTRRVTAETREAGGWVDTMGSMMQYGGKVVNDGLIRRIQIKAVNN